MNLKKFRKILLFIFVANTCFSQGNFYYYKDNKVKLEISTEKIFLKFNKDVSEIYKRKIINSFSSIITPDDFNLSSPSNSVILSLNKTTEQDVINLIKELNKFSEIEIANHFYNENTMGVSDQFMVKLKNPSDFIKLEQLAKETNTQILKQNEFLPSIYHILANKYSKGNALKMANYFYENGDFDFCEPDFCLVAENSCSNDTYFSQQWGLQNTGQYSGISGIDIKICEAWNITKGSPDIIVAVIDEGVDLNHPDLQGNLVDGYDATDAVYGGQNGSYCRNDAHGTACAGIIAAKGNNNLGISGVAPNCKIMPIRYTYHSTSNSQSSTITKTSWVVNAISWAVENGADIISNSWALFGNTDSLMTVETAFNNAIFSGRNGLGCVVVVASGNYSQDFVSFPSSIFGVIAVGAMTNNGSRASFSNYGSDLDVVAPGVNIYTTDISGSAGYTNNDYREDFEGTSAACPFVAGIAALVLSVNPCLTQEEAKAIIFLSCDKVGNYCYLPTNPYGFKSFETGYGKVNAYKAVKYANSLQITSFINESYSSWGTDGQMNSLILANHVCPNIAASMYSAKMYIVYKSITFPYTPNPFIIGSVNGMSAANPNSGDYYFHIENITETSALLKTWVYELYSQYGQSLGFIPTTPQNVKFNITVLSQLEENSCIQNQTISSGTTTFYAINKIEVGNNVTSTIPTGNVIIDGSANVTLHAGNEIVIMPGTTISPETGGSFVASIEPFFTCTQNTAKSMNIETDFPIVIENYDVKLKDIKENEIIEKQDFSLNIFPNPTNSDFTIKYTLNETEKFVNIYISDEYGRVCYNLSNNYSHNAGIYEIKMSGIHLPNGNYHVTIKTNKKTETKQLIILK